MVRPPVSPFAASVHQVERAPAHVERDGRSL